MDNNKLLKIFKIGGKVAIWILGIAGASFAACKLGEKGIESKQAMDAYVPIDTEPDAPNDANTTYSEVE